jgi:hypothetical protein
VNLRADRGDIQITSDVNGDRNGTFSMVHKKSTVATNGSVFIGSTALQTGAVSIMGVSITARKGLQIHSSDTVLFGAATRLKNAGDVVIHAARNILLGAATQISSTGSIDLGADRTNAALDGNDGLLEIGTKVKLTAKGSLHAAAYQVAQASGSVLKSPNTTVEQG